jgi:hypothetical protein
MKGMLRRQLPTRPATIQWIVEIVVSDPDPSWARLGERHSFAFDTPVPRQCSAFTLDGHPLDVLILEYYEN